MHRPSWCVRTTLPSAFKIGLLLFSAAGVASSRMMWTCESENSNAGFEENHKNSGQSVVKFAYELSL